VGPPPFSSLSLTRRISLPFPLFLLHLRRPAVETKTTAARLCFPRGSPSLFSTSGGIDRRGRPGEEGRPGGGDGGRVAYGPGGGRGGRARSGRGSFAGVGSGRGRRSWRR
jgi:hypothetical protein